MAVEATEQKGKREVMVCRSTGLPVIMEFTGSPSEEGESNGHPGWICLHGDCPEDDAKDVEDFRAGRKPSTPLWTK